MITHSSEAVRQAIAARMRVAAAAFVDSLSDEQRGLAHHGFPDTRERHQWFYTPTDHGGLTLGSMTPAQQSRWFGLLATGLSGPGYATVSTVVGLENVLDHVEGHRIQPGDGRLRDSNRYFARIFGNPGDPDWGWRFGGHHVSLNYTILNGALAAGTPSFLGADPASTPLLGGLMLRPLGGLQDTALDLMSQLKPQQSAIAIVSPVPPVDTVGGNRPSIDSGDSYFEPRGLSEVWRGELEAHIRRHFEGTQRILEQRIGLTSAHRKALRMSATPIGLPAAEMTASQKDTLLALLEQYVGRLPDAIAALELEKVSGKRFDGLHFAWAGATQPGEPIYYRIQGDGVVIEFDNTQSGANHIHSVWRDPRGDFGADLLAEHYTTAHAHGRNHEH